MMTLLVLILSLGVLALVLWDHLIWVWYAVVLLSPFTGLVIDFHALGFVQDVPYVNSINAPAADFVALFFVCMVALKMIVRIARGTFQFRAEAGAAGWYYILPFLCVALASVMQVDPSARLTALKYFVRPILFFYAVWIVAPLQVVVNKAMLKRSILVFFSTGMISALMGAVSMFTQESAFGFVGRAAPIGFGTLFPLGFNHNLLAEVLVASAPIAAYLMWRAEEVALRKWYFLGFALITAVALLTFSRAAWIALIAEGSMYIYFKHVRIMQMLKFSAPLLLFFVPIIAYMIFFIQTPIATSSNATRVDLTGIAWESFKAHPFLGNGIGTFVPLVEETRVFTLEYGDPLDAHGVAQKLIAEVGIAGFIAFFVFVWWCLSRMFRVYLSRPAGSASRTMLMCSLMSASGSFIFQLFNTSYYGAHLWLPVGLGLVSAHLFDAHRM